MEWKLRRIDPGKEEGGRGPWGRCGGRGPRRERRCADGSDDGGDADGDGEDVGFFFHDFIAPHC